MAGNWKEVPILDIAERVAMGPFGSSIKIETFVESGIPVISGQHLHGSRLKDVEYNFVTEEHADRLKKANVQRGDIIFTHAGNIGQVAYIPADSKYKRYVISQRQFYMRCDPAKATPEFITYYFNSKEGQHKLLANTSSTGVPSIAQPVTYLRSIVIPLPPLPEQKRIAHILGTLDDKIELNRRMNKTLEEMARALFKSWFIDFDPVRAKAEGRQPEGMDDATAKLFPSSFEDSELGRIPKGWRVGTIEDATSLILDHRGRTPKKMGSEWSVRGIPAVSAKNVKGGRLVRSDMFNFVSEELYERWMKDKLLLGDILMTSEAPLGELLYLVLNANFCLSQRIFALRANPSCCESSFLYYWLESPFCQLEIMNRGTGTTVEGIRQSELRKVSVLIPPLSIQKASAKFLSLWTKQIHHQEEQSLSLANLRDTLLPRLMDGDIKGNLPEAL